MANVVGEIFTIDNVIGLARLNTLPERFLVAFEATLAIRMSEVADAVIKDAQMQLVPGHGYDTGLLHDTLTKQLNHLVGQIIGYSLLSEQAEYWAYVEFGHMLVNGGWWEGYHYLATAIEMNKALLWQKCRQAFEEACAITRGGVPLRAELTGGML